MKLYYFKGDDINQNQPVVHSDNSFGYQSTCCYWDFQVSLNSSASFILNFDTFNGYCTSCEGYIHLAQLTDHIPINEYTDAKLMIELTQEEKATCSGHYYLNGKVLYDEINNRICLGEITQGSLIRFGVGQYASFDNGRLIGIIVDFL